MSASPPSSTASPAPAGPSSRPWPARPATCSSAPAEWHGPARSPWSTPAACSARRPIPLHELVVEHGLRALEHGRPRRLRRRRAARGSCRATRKSRSGCMRSGVPVVARRQQDRRQARRRAARVEFYRLGFEPVVEVAAEHGDGVAELLDEVVARLPARPPRQSRRRRADGDGRRHRRPAERGQVVARQPAAARRARDGERDARHDARHRRRAAAVAQADVPARGHGRACGGRAASRASGQVEAVSVVLAKRAMARADVVVLVVDATEGAGDREGAIAGEAEEAGCGIVIAVNKWDLVQGPGAGVGQGVRRQAAVPAEVPRLRADRPPLGARPASARRKLLEAIDRVAAARQKRVPTAELNKFLEAVTAAHPPVSKTRREVRILYACPDRHRRRRRSCCSRTSRPSCTSRTSGFSSTGCASRSGSRARRSG